MNRPQDIPQEVWNATKGPFDTLYEDEGDLEGGCEHGIREMCARLVMAAVAEEREECALVMERTLGLNASAIRNRSNT